MKERNNMTTHTTLFIGGPLAGEWISGERKSYYRHYELSGMTETLGRAGCYGKPHLYALQRVISNDGCRWSVYVHFKTPLNAAAAVAALVQLDNPPVPVTHG